jgi:ribA/ribD-fused uncharacterized protein
MSLANDYRLTDCVIFCKTKETHGGLHNMAGGYPIKMGTVSVLTSEHLFQAMRFTEYPDIQRELLAIASPMTAKMFGRSHIEKTRADWQNVRVEIMEWCLDLKYLNNPKAFGDLLQATGKKLIVELSRKNAFWGAIPLHEGSGILRGQNVCGTLLWLLRRRVAERLSIFHEPQITIPEFRFLGEDAVSLAKDGLLL